MPSNPSIRSQSRGLDGFHAQLQNRRPKSLQELPRQRMDNLAAISGGSRRLKDAISLAESRGAEPGQLAQDLRSNDSAHALKRLEDELNSYDRLMGPNAAQPEPRFAPSEATATLPLIGSKMRSEAFSDRRYRNDGGYRQIVENRLGQARRALDLNQPLTPGRGFGVADAPFDRGSRLGEPFAQQSAPLDYSAPNASFYGYNSRPSRPGSNAFAPSQALRNARPLSRSGLRFVGEQGGDWVRWAEEEQPISNALPRPENASPFAPSAPGQADPTEDLFSIINSREEPQPRPRTRRPNAYERANAIMAETQARLAADKDNANRAQQRGDAYTLPGGLLRTAEYIPGRDRPRPLLVKDGVAPADTDRSRDAEDSHRVTSGLFDAMRLHLELHRLRGGGGGGGAGGGARLAGPGGGQFLQKQASSTAADALTWLKWGWRVSPIGAFVGGVTAGSEQPRSVRLVAADGQQFVLYPGYGAPPGADVYAAGQSEDGTPVAWLTGVAPGATAGELYLEGAEMLGPVGLIVKDQHGDYGLQLLIPELFEGVATSEDVAERVRHGLRNGPASVSFPALSPGLPLPGLDDFLLPERAQPDVELPDLLSALRAYPNRTGDEDVIYLTPAQHAALSQETLTLVDAKGFDIAPDDERGGWIVFSKPPAEVKAAVAGASKEIRAAGGFAAWEKRQSDERWKRILPEQGEPPLEPPQTPHEKALRLLWQRYLRRPAGNHEWFMVSLYRHLRRFGIRAKDVKSPAFRTPTRSPVFIDPDDPNFVWSHRDASIKGHRAVRLSDEMHTELKFELQAVRAAETEAETLESLYEAVRRVGDKWVKGGRTKLPPGPLNPDL